MEAILALKEINGSFTYICSSKNNKPVPKRAFDRAYRQICSRAGIDPAGVHSLRHTFASKLFRKGADIKTVSELLGHATTKITYNTYIHIMPEQKKSAIALLDDKPKRKLIATESLTIDEFNDELEKGYKDMIDGKIRSATEVFDNKN